MKFTRYNISLLTRIIISIVVIFLLFQQAAAYSADKDSSINIPDSISFNNSVYSLAMQANGKFFVGGAFTLYSGVVTNRIVRLNSDGTRDATFNIGSGFNNLVRSIAIQNDGKIIIGGMFTTYNGTGSNYIVRLNNDGSKDPTFNIGSGLNGNVRSIAIQNNGKILFGGGFSTYNGTTVNRLVRLNSDGTKDATFNIGNGFNNNNIRAIVVQSDGKIVVGGDFTVCSGVTTNRIVRLNSDGTRDYSFDIGNGFDNQINSINITTGGKFIVGGRFTTYSGVAANRIVRLNSDGTRDYSFNVGSGFNDQVRSVTIQSDDKIIIGGAFSTYSGVTANRIVRLNSDGTRDYSFDVGSGFNNTTNTLAIQSDDKIIVGGDFTTYKSISGGYLARLHGNSLVSILSTTNTNTIYTEFTSKGYTLSGSILSGSAPIVFIDTLGIVPIELGIKNDNIILTLPQNIGIKNKSDNTDYTGAFYPPISIAETNKPNTIAAFSVGANNKSLQLIGGVSTLSVPVPEKVVGDPIEVYYSEDNGETRQAQTTTTVINIGGQPYVEFTTNHFTDFAITTPIIFTGSFTINNDAISTTSNYVNLDISTTPAASKMRFSDDGVTRPSRENYATTKSWTLPGTYESKTVYAQFSIYGDGTIDVETMDSIDYIDPNGGGNNGGGSCVAGGPGTACLSLEILAVTGECRYGQNLDLGDHAQQYATFNMTGAFTGNNNTYPLRWSCNDTAGKSPINRDMQISSTDLIATGAGGNQYIISSDQIEIKTDISKVYQGDASVFTGEIGSFLDRGTNITIPKIIFKKISPQGTVGELGTDSVDLRVIVPANQEIGQYQATITIAFPQM